MMKYILKFAGWYIGNKSKYDSCRNFKIHYTEDLFPLVGITSITSISEVEEDFIYESRKEKI